MFADLVSARDVNDMVGEKKENVNIETHQSLFLYVKSNKEERKSQIKLRLMYLYVFMENIIYRNIQSNSEKYN